MFGHLIRRGPDGCKEVSLSCQFGKQLCMFGTLLQMRGDITEQPFTRRKEGLYASFKTF